MSEFEKWFISTVALLFIHTSIAGEERVREKPIYLFFPCRERSIVFFVSCREKNSYFVSRCKRDEREGKGQVSFSSK